MTPILSFSFESLSRTCTVLYTCTYTHAHMDHRVSERKTIFKKSNRAVYIVHDTGARESSSASAQPNYTKRADCTVLHTHFIHTKPYTTMCYTCTLDELFAYSYSMYVRLYSVKRKQFQHSLCCSHSSHSNRRRCRRQAEHSFHPLLPSHHRHLRSHSCEFGISRIAGWFARSCVHDMVQNRNRRTAHTLNERSHTYTHFSLATNFYSLSFVYGTIYTRTIFGTRTKAMLYISSVRSLACSHTHTHTKECNE